MSNEKFKFIITQEAWYSKTGPLSEREPEIMIGDYTDEGCTGEFAIRWRDLDHGRRPPSPQLHMFNDCWEMIPDLLPLFTMLTDIGNANAAPEDVAVRLLDLGYEDITQREPPEEEDYVDPPLPRCPEDCPMFKHRCNE